MGFPTNETIELLPNIELQISSYSYRFYIWVDESDAFVSLAEGKDLDIELWMDVYQEEPLKVFKSYCYTYYYSPSYMNSVIIRCNILDSEKSLSGYYFTNHTSLPPLQEDEEWSDYFEPLTSSEYWKIYDNVATPTFTISSYMIFDDPYMHFMTSDERFTYSELNTAFG